MIKKIIPLGFILFILMGIDALATTPNTIYPRTCISGGPACLNALDGNCAIYDKNGNCVPLLDGDGAFVVGNLDGPYFYYLNATSGANANPPAIVMPATNAGLKRWIRIRDAGSGAGNPGGSPGDVQCNIGGSFGACLHVVDQSLLPVPSNPAAGLFYQYAGGLWGKSAYTLPTAVCTNGHIILSDGTNMNCSANALGTSAWLNVGIGPNNIVQLDSSSRLPALDGSLLINLPSGFSNPMTTIGDIIIGGTAGAATRKAKGANDSFFSVDDSGNLDYHSVMAMADDNSNHTTYGLPYHFYNYSDPTKKVLIDVSGLSSNTIRKIYMPDYDIHPSSTIANGVIALATSSISSGACQTVTQGSVNSTAASGVATTDIIEFIPNASIKAVTGYAPSTTGGLTITPYPTANYVNFDVCNWSASPITPGAVTLNWRVVR